jgi:hypothetical protein
MLGDILQHDIVMRQGEHIRASMMATGHRIGTSDILAPLPAARRPGRRTGFRRG